MYKRQVWYIVEILIMLLATAFLHNLQGSFDRAQVSKAAFWAAYVVICTIAALSLIHIYRDVRHCGRDFARRFFGEKEGLYL